MVATQPQAQPLHADVNEEHKRYTDAGWHALCFSFARRLSTPRVMAQDDTNQR